MGWDITGACVLITGGTSGIGQAAAAELARRGYSQVEMELIASRNAIRVLRDAERYAASVSDQLPIETLIPSED